MNQIIFTQNPRSSLCPEDVSAKIKVAQFWNSCLLEACATFKLDGQSHQKSGFQVGGVVIKIIWNLDSWQWERKDSYVTKIISEENFECVTLKPQIRAVCYTFCCMFKVEENLQVN